jgi:putative FmdB family regulatory protein
MPIYEYRCEPCQNQFESFVMTSSEQPACPSCESADVKKLMSTFASVVPGGYKSAQASANGAAGAPAPGPAAPKAGGHSHGAGCGCH